MQGQLLGKFLLFVFTNSCCLLLIEEAGLRCQAVWPAVRLPHLQSHRSHRCRRLPRMWGPLSVSPHPCPLPTAFCSHSLLFTAGKSTFFHAHVIPKGYFYVNRVSGVQRKVFTSESFSCKYFRSLRHHWLLHLNHRHPLIGVSGHPWLLAEMRGGVWARS